MGWRWMDASSCIVLCCHFKIKRRTACSQNALKTKEGRQKISPFQAVVLLKCESFSAFTLATLVLNSPNVPEVHFCSVSEEDLRLHSLALGAGTSAVFPRWPLAVLKQRGDNRPAGSTGWEANVHLLSFSLTKPPSIQANYFKSSNISRAQPVPDCQLCASSRQSVSVVESNKQISRK